MTRPERKDIALAVGIVGVLTATALVVFGNTSDLRYVWTGEIGVVVLAGPSAWLAGLMCSDTFGHPRAEGCVLAFLGACLSTMLGAAIAGTILVPLFGTMIAPAALLDEAIANPTIAFVWLSLMAGLHVIILKSTQ